MKRLGLRFPSGARAFFSAAFLLSLISGLLWFSLDRWGEIEGEFGPEKHPWLASLAKIHGAGAFIALISFGMIFSTHLPVGWRTRQARKSGLSVLICILIITISAWGLYYAGSDETRALLVWIHLAAGLALPLTIALHVRGKRRGVVLAR